MGDPEGRLELTWANKRLRLLAHEDGTYEWVDPADHRVAEVRLLHEHSTVGEIDKTRAADNILIRGDALHALRSLSEIPEFARGVAGKVRLCYMDPPFNTGVAFTQYDDGLEHSVWLTMMRDRLMQVRSLLSADGSVWVHLNDTEMAYCKVIMDEVFGRDNAIAVIVWEKTYTPKSNGRGVSTDHDYIVGHAKDASVWLSRGCNLLPRSEEQAGRFKNPDDDPKGPWRTYPLDVRTENETRRAAYRYPVTLPSGRVVRPAQGRHWALPQERFEREREQGLIWFGAEGNAMPTRKVYLAEAREGVIARSWWIHEETGSSQDAKRECKVLFPEIEPFATPKPEALMHRLLQIGTKPGDLVLDCFVGSGTTAAVAHKMGRRWIGVEWSPETVATFTLPRLTRVVEGSDRGGATEVTGWAGGGGFHVLDVAPSMYTEVSGMVFLSEWATNGALAEATAAQLGFDYDADLAPFCGRKGRRRLAVVDGLVDTNVLKLLMGELEPGEQVVVAGTSIDPAARAELPKGSSLRKIPDALLQSYQRDTRLADLVPPASAPGVPG